MTEQEFGVYRHTNGMKRDGTVRVMWDAYSAYTNKSSPRFVGIFIGCGETRAKRMAVAIRRAKDWWEQKQTEGDER